MYETAFDRCDLGLHFTFIFFRHFGHFKGLRWKDLL